MHDEIQQELINILQRYEATEGVESLSVVKYEKIDPDINIWIVEIHENGMNPAFIVSESCTPNFSQPNTKWVASWSGVDPHEITVLRLSPPDEEYLVHKSDDNGVEYAYMVWSLPDGHIHENHVNPAPVIL